MSPAMLFYGTCSKLSSAAQKAEALVLVAPKGEVRGYTDIISGYGIKKSIDIVEGGDTRMESSFNG